MVDDQDGLIHQRAAWFLAEQFAAVGPRKMITEGMAIDHADGLAIVDYRQGLEFWFVFKARIYRIIFGIRINGRHDAKQLADRRVAGIAGVLLRENNDARAGTELLDVLACCDGRLGMGFGNQIALREADAQVA